MTQAKAPAGAKRTPLWTRVQDDLRARIGRGDFAQGFPGELLLAREYGVSRATIRAALGPLRRGGLVTARPGRPSLVVDVADENRYGPVYSLFAAVERTGMAQRSEVEAIGLGANPAAAGHLGLTAGTELVFISRRRFADSTVIAADDAWLPASLAAPVLEADLSHTALYEVLQTECGITLSSGTEHLHAITTDAPQSRRLDCAPGSAAFFIERLGRAAGEPVEWRETLIRGDSFTVTTSYPAAGA
ncbi:GntR family transcriptional regulator [Arthrobacter sp.]|uniref:GntR family transcriptional regulator n=1 Tax=Arthrobacter sp. TaxID=1667 RepID=UPI003A8F6BA0